MTIDGTYCRAFTLPIFLFNRYADRCVKLVTLRRDHCTRCLSDSSLIHTSNPVSSHTRKKNSPTLTSQTPFCCPLLIPLTMPTAAAAAKAPKPTICTAPTKPIRISLRPFHPIIDPVFTHPNAKRHTTTTAMLQKNARKTRAR